MKTSELIVALREMLERHGDLEVGAYYDSGYGEGGVEGVFRDKAGDLMLRVGEGADNARRMYEHPDDVSRNPSKQESLPAEFSGDSSEDLIEGVYQPRRL